MRPGAEGIERLGLERTLEQDFGLDSLAQKVSYHQETGQVIYRSKMTHGRNQKNFEIFSALDFIAAITQHIPEQSFQLVRYYGVSFLAYLVDTQTVCGATGRSWNRRRGRARQMELAA